MLLVLICANRADFAVWFKVSVKRFVCYGLGRILHNNEQSALIFFSITVLFLILIFWKTEVDIERATNIGFLVHGHACLFCCPYIIVRNKQHTTPMY